jgi:hypothetical protein
MDRRFGEGCVRALEDVASADLGAPRAEGVDGEGAGSQAHPLQAASGSRVLDLLVSVPSIAGRLLVEVVVDVHRGQCHHPLHPLFGGERQQFDGRGPDGAWVQEQSGDALQEGAIVSGRDGSPSTTSTWAGRPAASGLRVAARMSAPSVVRRSMSGRPIVPVAPVTRIMTNRFCLDGCLLVGRRVLRMAYDTSYITYDFKMDII